MILFLDDDEERHDAFIARWCAVGNQPCHHVRTAAEAIQALTDSTYTGVFLDHDLSYEDQNHELGAQTKERTGMDVVDHLVRMKRAWDDQSTALNEVTSGVAKKPPEVVFVHSLNYDAAVEMCHRLGDAGYQSIFRVPFHVLIQQLPLLMKKPVVP